MKLTFDQAKQDFETLPMGYKTADVDRLIRNYIKNRTEVSELRPHVLTHQEFHRVYYFVTLKQMKNVDDRMTFIHENLLFNDWWHTDQLIKFVADLDFEIALNYAKDYVNSDDPFIRRWGYVLFISRLGRGNAAAILPLLHNDDHYYVQMAEAWLIAELAIFEPEFVYEWMMSCGLKYNITGKAVQKICDSFRISGECKTRFKSIRPTLQNQN